LLAALRRIRGLVQLVLLAALLTMAASFFYSPGRMLTVSGLLFDIAGALRLFLLEEIHDAMGGFKPNKYGNFPSVVTRELIAPEAAGPYDAQSSDISLFYYKKRGVFFLFIGFLLQLVGALIG
jgi:hypothetical protein